MHVVHVLTRLLRAGAEENTLSTCEWQARRGHRVTVVHGNEFDPFWYDRRIPGLTLLHVPQMVHALRPAADFRALAVLRRLLRDLSPDVIHTHQSKAGILGRLAASSVPGAALVHGVHIVPFDGVQPLKARLYVAAERLAARRTDQFIAVSNAVGDAYVNAGITRPGRVHCVRSGIDLDKFRHAAQPKDWRDLIGVARGGTARKELTVAVMLASFEPRKNHLPLLRALETHVHRAPNLRLILAGDGPLHRVAQDMVDRSGMSRQVTLCGHRSDPEALLALSDLSILVSRREGLPRVVVQSLTAKRPVVVADLPGISEIVQPGRNGIITPAADMDAAACALVDLSRDPAQMRRLKHGAAETDVSEWAEERLGELTTRLYGLAAHPQRARPRRAGGDVAA